MFQYHVEFHGTPSTEVNADYFVVERTQDTYNTVDAYFYTRKNTGTALFPVWEARLTHYARNPRLITNLGNAPEVNVAPPKSGLDNGVLPC